MDDATQDTYTPEQRETLEAGLRILARVIVREHLRRQAGVQADPNETASGPETRSIGDGAGA